MKNTTIILVLMICGLLARAQETELAQKQKELEQSQAEMTVLKARLESLQSEVEALKPPVYWKKGGFTALNYNTVGLRNWAAGGVEANAISALGNVFANYSKDKINWVNNLDLAYGIIQNDGKEYQKNEDKIDFLSKLGYKASERLSYAALGNFKSQFAPGYDFNDVNEDRPVISRFMSPAVLNISLGLDYKLTDYISVYLSPAAGKFTFVMDDSIAAMNIYIPSTEDAQGIQFYSNNYRAEFGAFFNALLNKELGKNMSLRSRLDLFCNYTDKNNANRKNIDVNWETMVNLKVSKYIGVSLFTQVIYDNDIDIPTDFDNTTGSPIAFGPRLQFKRVLGVGFSYKF